MGFGFTNKKQPKSNTGPSVELLHTLECKACPLNKILENLHPNMKPTGDYKPVVYILGEAPGKKEDRKGIQFIGGSGEILRSRLPDDLPMRFNNVVRTRPPKNRNPEPVEIEACRPSVTKDIAKSKPEAIFGFGNIPLKWASNMSGIMAWRGRRFPVVIGGHHTWYYPMAHPAYILRQRSEWARKKGPTAIGSEEERMFVFDLKRALKEVRKGLPEPVVHTREMIEAGVEIYKGGPGQFKKLRKRLEWFSRQYAVGVDYEATRLRPFYEDSKILTVAVSNGEISVSFAMDHPEAEWTDTERKDIDELWLEFLKSPVRKIAHNAPSELIWTAVFYGLETIFAAPWECTLTQASTLDNRGGRDGDSKRKMGTKKGEGPLSLQFLCFQYFGFDLKGISKVNLKKLASEPIEKVLKYNALDGKYHFLLFGEQKERLVAMKQMGPYKRSRERMATLAGSQYLGMPTDPKATKMLEEKYTEELRIAIKRLRKLPEADKYEKKFQEKFDPINNNHVIAMLRDVMKRKEGWVYDEKKKKDKYSADKKILAKIDHPICPLILEARQAQHKMSTYLYHNTGDKIMVWPDKHIHAIFNHGPSTNTHRLSSEDPNLQNIPKRTEGLKEVRVQIVAKAPPWARDEPE